MSTYTQILYQIIFSTAGRQNILRPTGRQELFLYISGIIHRRKCQLYFINGVEDHIHIVTHLHPTVALADLVKDIKVGSSIWIKEQGVFPGFNGWQSGYAAMTYSVEAKNHLKSYVLNQEEHHRKTSFREEFRKLLNDHEIDFDEKYLP